MSEFEGAGLMGLFAVLGILFLVLFVIFIVLYVLMSLGLYRLAANRGIENPWLAWIPIANLYIIAKLIKTLKIGEWEVPNLEMFLPLSVVVVIFISWIPLIGFLASIANAVLFYFALHKLYKIYRPQSATLWLVLSIILSFMMPIFLFIMRNDSPVELV